MQNVSREENSAKAEGGKVNVLDIGSSSTPRSTSDSNSSPAKSETETFSEHRRYLTETESSDSEEDSVSEDSAFSFEDEKLISKLLEEVKVEEFEETQVVAAKFLLNPDEDRAVDPETQARLEALLQAAGISQLAAKDGKHLADPEVLRRLTSSVSCALDEAAAALTRMRSDQPRTQPEKTSLVEACTDGDVGTVRKLLTEGRSVHETSEEGESLLSLACSAGYYELAQVLLAMHANVEDRGIKGECTPLMEAASSGHLEIVRLLIKHGADVNAQSTSGNTPLMYGCAGGHTEVVKFLLERGANVEDHNENGHTPLMEAASAGHVGLARILLNHGAGINTHSNEFKESALTLACYKGHLDMVRFLLEAGADQEHKTDEMHTALMEASMDGHVEVARLLLDSGAQVNMPTDSFESPLTLAACGGHVDLAMLLIERGANIEEVNDEGYTPLMEAAREGHEEMVHLLLGQGANINAQTDETQETALTLACCGGFTEVADILLKGGADIELGASTPLMEAAQEGHLDLVKFLLDNGANVHAQTQTGDSALTYACENGHTDVADYLLQYGADLEHESEGGRTPLMKACRAGHVCTVQFLISKGANVRRQTTNNDHTPLSLACAGGHINVVEILLSHNADPCHKLKDNSTMLIEAAKGGHTNVVQLLLDYPHSVQHLVISNQGQPGATTATNLAMLPGQVGSRDSPLPPGTLPPTLPAQPITFFQPPPAAILQEVPEAVRIVSQDETSSTAAPVDVGKQQQVSPSTDSGQCKKHAYCRKSTLLSKSRSTSAVYDANAALTSAEAQQVRTQPLPIQDFDVDTMDFINKEDTNSTLIDFIKSRKKQYNIISSSSGSDEGTTQKQQILEELHRVERELHGKQPPQHHAFQYNLPTDQVPNTNSPLPHMLNIDIALQQQQGLGAGMTGSMFPANNLQVHNAFYTGSGGGVATACSPLKMATLAGDGAAFAPNVSQPAFYFTPLSSSVALPTATTSATSQQPIKFQSVTSHVEVSQNTAISDRPKAKPVSKKEGKNIRKQQLQQHQYQSNLYSQHPSQVFSPVQLQQQQPQQQFQQIDISDESKAMTIQEAINSMQGLDLDSLDDSLVLKEETPENLLTASILQQFQNSSIRTAFAAPERKTIPLDLYSHTQDKVTKLEISDKDFTTVEDVVQTLESFSASDLADQGVSQHDLQVQPFTNSIDESMIATFTGQDPDMSRVEYFAVPTSAAQIHAVYPYDPYLAATGMANKDQSGAIYQAGFQAGINLMQQQLACPSASTSETVTSSAPVVPATVGVMPTSSVSAAQFISPPQQVVQQVACTSVQAPCSHIQHQPPTTHHCQAAVPCPQGHAQQLCLNQQHQQVQAATQTQIPQVPADSKKPNKVSDGMKVKKGRVLRHQNQSAQGGNFQQNQTFPADPASTPHTQYTGATPNIPATTVTGLDVDSKTDSNHDTALTLACAGGHDELVDLLVNRGADIEHRDKKGFTPLILAATAGHEKVVEVLINHSADIEAQSERTKDTPLSLACSGGRYEVVELLLNRNANKEHRNVSDYTPLSLAASGGYVNIIKLLLSHGAEINSRTGSKLGISPLMLAAMNGHTAAVKLLLDMGSDINAQIETNRNTALTLACFQGRHEVVSLLLDRKANVEHRAKTGLTPLMEAASGGYVDVGRVLLDKGADVNATPVPSSRDTALTIAADKGHVRFVELLLCRGALVEVKNKKGNSPLWLAANGGHLAVVELLYNIHADIDSQDNRKVSCLMAAFRKGHVKVVKWMVAHVTQFPSDQEMIRYISTVSDKELLEKCQECVKVIRMAKETQAAKANKNASILLEELDMEKTREENKRQAAARRRERKKKKKLEKKEEKRKLLEENKKNENYDDKDKKLSGEDEKVEEEENIQDVHMESAMRGADVGDKEEGDSGIDANSQGSCSSNDIKPSDKRKDKKKKKTTSNSKASISSSKAGSSKGLGQDMVGDSPDKRVDGKGHKLNSIQHIRKGLVFEPTKSPAERDDFEATGNENYVSSSCSKPKKSHGMSNFESDGGCGSAPLPMKNSPSPKQASKREEGWKEVVRKSSVQAVSTSESGVKKVSVPLNAISRVIGRGGSNINAIRAATGAHIEVEKQSKGQGERSITIKGSAEATKQAHNLILVLIKDPDVDILQSLPRANKTATSTTSLWDKTQIGTKKVAGKAMSSQSSVPVSASTSSLKSAQAAAATLSVSQSSRSATSGAKASRSGGAGAAGGGGGSRVTAPRLVAQAEKERLVAQSRGSASSSAAAHGSAITSSLSSTSSGRIATKVVTSTANPQTFAAKLSESGTTASAMGPLSVSVGQAQSYHGAGSGNSNSSANPSSSKSRSTLSVPPTSNGPIGPVSPQPSQSHNVNSVTITNATTTNPVHSSPKHSARPAPTASAPPNMQHYQSPGKNQIFAHSSQSSNSIPVSESAGGSSSGATSHHPRSSTPNIIQSSPPSTVQLSSSNCNTEEMGHVNPSNHLATPSEYSLFYSTDQSMWRRGEHEAQKPINFAAVTGGGGGSSAQPSAIMPPSTSKYLQEPSDQPLVDAKKAPGYRGTTVCSPVSSKASSNSTTPPNISGSSSFQVYPSDPPKSQQQLPMPIGTSIGRSVSQTSNQNEVPYYANIFKAGSTDIPHGANMINMSNDGGHLLQTAVTYHQSVSLKNLGYSSQSQQMPLVSMSRLNPKAPDFSSSNYNPGMQPSKQTPQQLYNGYQMPNQNSYPTGKAGGGMDSYHRSSAQTTRWNLMQMQQPFTPQQTELISGMATGMTLHNLARATGSEILDSSGVGELGINVVGSHHSPHMSPNMGGGGGGMHSVVDPSGPSSIYTSDHKPPPIGTERGRWIYEGVVKQPPRWPGNSAANENFGMPRTAQVYADDMPQLIDTFHPGMTLADNAAAYANVSQMPPYLMQQQPMSTMRAHDILPVDLSSWDGTRGGVNDMQENKQHAWNAMSNKWNP